MNYSKPFIVFTALLSISTSAKATTIADSINKALATNPTVDVAKSQKILSEQQFLENRSGLFPVANANIQMGRIYSDNSTSRGLTVDRGAAYSFLGEAGGSLTQPIFDGHETSNRMDASKARITASDYTILDTRENVALSAAQAHIAVLQARDTLMQTKAYYDIIQDYQNRIQLMVNEGVADETEIAQAKNINIQLQSTVTDIEGQLQAAYATYRQVTGSMPESQLRKPVINIRIHDDVELAVNQAKSNHPLLMSGREELKALTHEVDAEKSTFYPDVDGELSFLKRDQKEEIGGELTDARAVVRMNWDFEIGGAQKARERQKKASYLETLNRNKETAREIESNIRRAYVEYGTASRQKQLVISRAATTKELFEAYNTQFEGARVRLLQLMQAENQLFNAKLEAISADYRYLQSQINILSSLGQLTENLSFLQDTAPSTSTSIGRGYFSAMERKKQDLNLFGDFGQVAIKEDVR